jgi:preprotein translocase SecE subunit
MATAVEPSSQQTTPPNPQARLVFASLIGAVYVVAALAAVFYAVPVFWRETVAPQLGGFTFIDVALRIAAQIAVALGLVWFGQSLAGANPPKGIRGGIFLMISAAITIFFLVRAVGLNFEGAAGQIAMLVFGAVLVFFTFRLFMSPRGERWMVGLEEQGWLSTHHYKRALGVKVRRLTILGILLIGGTGAYSLYVQNLLPQDWKLAMPGMEESVTLLSDARVVIPALMMGLILWFAWRVVNLPTFAEFLIATEAEMNKVSWTSRRRLYQDTVVVLVTTLLLTLFLLVVDLFWGWLLSRERIGVLPSKPAEAQKGGRGEEARW